MTQVVRSILFALIATTPLACSSLAPEVGAERPACDAGCADAASTTDGSNPADAGADGTASVDGAPLVSFARDLRPIVDRLPGDPRGPGCASCHYRSAADPIGIQRSGLDMTTLGSLRLGGTTSRTTIVIGGRPDDSAIVQKLRGTYFTGKRMPYNGPPYLTNAEVQLFADWIAQGALGADSE